MYCNGHIFRMIAVETVSLFHHRRRRRCRNFEHLNNFVFLFSIVHNLNTLQLKPLPFDLRNWDQAAIEDRKKWNGTPNVRVCALVSRSQNLIYALVHSNAEQKKKKCERRTFMWELIQCESVEAENGSYGMIWTSDVIVTGNVLRDITYNNIYSFVNTE